MGDVSRLLGCLAAIAVVLSPVAAGAGTTRPGLFERNLVANPGAEEGPAGGQGGNVAVAGWVDTSAATVQPYDAFFPLPAELPQGHDLGTRCFHGGLAGESGISQEIDISAARADVDAGRVGFSLSGCLGGLGAGADSARLVARFRDAVGRPLSASSIGGDVAGQGPGVSRLRASSASGRVPQGTRSIAMTLRFHRGARQGPNHAAADNLSLILRTAAPRPEQTLRVLTFNILNGGAARGPLLHALNAIQLGQPDLVALQEPVDSGPAIAARLGYYHQRLRTRGGPAVLSRFPITETLSNGVQVRLPGGRLAWLFCVHLAPLPGDRATVARAARATGEELAAAARKLHAAAVAALLAEAGPRVRSGQIVFLAGDFNEPSHLDWTDKAARAGLHGQRVVPWPTSKALQAAGLADTFRLLHADEVARPGPTWPATGPAALLLSDRIDYIYHAGRQVKPVGVQILGPDNPPADLLYSPYPSDHRGVLATFEVSPPPAKQP